MQALKLQNQKSSESDNNKTQDLEALLMAEENMDDKDSYKDPYDFMNENHLDNDFDDVND